MSTRLWLFMSGVVLKYSVLKNKGFPNQFTTQYMIFAYVRLYTHYLCKCLKLCQVLRKNERMYSEYNRGGAVNEQVTASFQLIYDISYQFTWNQQQETKPNFR